MADLQPRLRSRFANPTADVDDAEASASVGGGGGALVISLSCLALCGCHVKKDRISESCLPERCKVQSAVLHQLRRQHGLDASCYRQVADLNMFSAARCRPEYVQVYHLPSGRIKRLLSAELVQNRTLQHQRGWRGVGPAASPTNQSPGSGRWSHPSERGYGCTMCMTWVIGA